MSSPEVEYAKPIDERIGTHTALIGDYQKSYSRVFALQTGVAVLTNEVPFLVIMDIDLRKGLPSDQKEVIYHGLLSRFTGRGARLVKTAHGGLHVYCNQGDFELASNREIKCYTCPDFEIDLFGCVTPSKKSMVLLPGSQIRDKDQAAILGYEIVDDPPGGLLTLMLADALAILDISLAPVVQGKKGKIRPQTTG
jgi:hypothetical protein